MFDESEVRKSIELMKPDGQLFEIRVIYDKKSDNVSGYFTSADKLIEELKKIPKKGGNVYITLNELNDACYSRTQKDVLQKFTTASTSDNDVVAFQWLMIDLDPIRPKGTSSSEEQIRLARDKGNAVYKFMSQVGFEKPLMAMSGNGVHLLYKIYLKNSVENKELLKKSLETLSMLFDDDEIKIDVVNFNPSRVCKLYGTLAQKGASTEDRPHRMSKALSDSKIQATKRDYLEKLIGYYPQVDTPKKYNNYNPSEFDIENWLGKYGLHYKASSFSGGTKYVLDHCVFDDNHKGKDACIIRLSNGALSYKCLHNSCADKTWQDVRKMFEPEAYERNYEYQNQRMYKTFNRDIKPAEKHIEPKADTPIFYTANDILNMPKVDETFVKTGIRDIDRLLRGLKKGFVSMWSGLRGSAKSTVLSQIILSAIDEGNTVAVYSGELSEKNFLRWMLLQAAGKSHTEKGQYEGYYNVPIKCQQKIASWLSDKLWLYNNEYGNDFKAILEQFEKVIDEKKIDFLVLDNLMSFNISTLADTKWDAQTQFVWSLHDLAQKKNVHIAFVAHPRKALGFLRLDDISGSADLGNAVENAFIVHRVNNDFTRLSQQMFAWKSDEDVYKATNVIEICKDRDGGAQDVFIPLWYEKESKRLKNYETENIIYGWDDEFKPVKPKINFNIEEINQEETPFN